jgi:general secretion pathway protein L
LLLPASDILLLEVDLPVKTASQIKKALPFALEDLLAEDVETYHLVWHRHLKDKVVVAAISNDKIQTYLSQFQDVGIQLDSVYSESLCLPYQSQSCSILIDQQQAILRTGQWLGGGIDVEILPAFVDKLLVENPELQTLQIWNAAALTPWLSTLTINKVEHTLDSSLQLLQAGVAMSGGELNLLTGPYSLQSKADWQWQKWLPALVIVLLAALIQTGVLINDYWQQKTELAALEAKTLALFQQTFPEVKRVVNIKAQADQQLIELKKQGAGNGSRFMLLLYQTGEILSANPGFKLQQLDFVNDIMQLQLTAPDISQIEQFKQQLESGNELSVKVQSAEAGQNAVEAHLEIKQK